MILFPFLFCDGLMLRLLLGELLFVLLVHPFEFMWHQRGHTPCIIFIIVISLLLLFFKVEATSGFVLLMMK